MQLHLDTELKKKLDNILENTHILKEDKSGLYNVHTLYYCCTTIVVAKLLLYFFVVANLMDFRCTFVKFYYKKGRLFLSVMVCYMCYYEHVRNNLF